MAKKTANKPLLIITCGNSAAGDDGFGHAVAMALRTDPLPGISVVELGTRPADLLDYAQGYASLIIVDAVCIPGEKPGGLLEVDWLDPARPALTSERALSSHGISLGQQIDLGQSLGMLTSDVRVVGVNIFETEVGQPMTETVRRCIPDAVRIIREYAVSRIFVQADFRL